MSKSSYSQVLKATSLFGGVQVFVILIGLIRSKLVAILLGTAGYGVNGLLQSPIGLIGSLTNLGLGFSAVRDIADAHSKEDAKELSRTIKTLRRWVWVTGMLGMLTVIILSPLLSEWTFGHKDYTWAFVCLSVTLLLTAISSGQTALLRGMRRINDTAKATVIGAAIGLITSVPLYYYYGVKGIVPALIISAIATLAISWSFSHRIRIETTNITYKESFYKGQKMAQIGIMVTLSGMITQAVSYLTILYINHQAGASEVGLYSAGWSITNQYVGLIFGAMAADYYPRLAGLQSDMTKMRDAVNHQAEIAILIIAPLMVLYLTFLPVAIKILFTPEFLPITEFSKWIILGMLFKTASWTLGFVILAKGDTKLFFIVEVVGNALVLMGSIGGYALWGLEGVGIGFVFCYMLHFLLMCVVSKAKYNVTFSKSFIRLFVMQLAISILTFGLISFSSFPWIYIAGSIMFIVSACLSLYELDKRIGLKEIIISKFKK